MRITNRLLAALFALALLVGGVILVVEVVAHWTGTDPVVFDWPAVHAWARRTTWSAIPVRLISVMLLLVGLALLWAQLKPRRFGRLALEVGHPATDVAVTRRGLAHSLAAAVSRVEGVHNAHVAVKGKKIKVSARTYGGRTADVALRREAVTRMAQERLDALPLRRKPTLAVRLSARAR
ncbi:hypothetical protein KZ829_39370 [Actinoplanes hulinensis]|uniref:DUF6286 domain-containing protein n=1 Tax=Actinoplanes hulinensis TaxID=1144547 RepID=A0ABS7BG00_9ACTN|nr:DUF6286 domain-containing protein [Actinoplanes hulinensis]MBW6439804.1 hypothetical protein [Actinoplanes hulinensis]